MKNWKKWGVSLGILATSLLALTACGSGESNSGSAGGSGKKELVVWTFTDELSKMINDYYKPAHEDLDYEIKVVEIPSDQFETKLDPVLGTKDAPDVIALESAFVKKYVESGLMADIGELGLDEASKDTYQYVKDVGTDKDGVLHALAWQGAPGGFYYRESMAKDLLGLEDVDKVQEALSDYNKFYEVAKEVKEKSNGDVYMISSVQDLAKPFFGHRDHGWVEDEKLVIDDKLYELLDISKKFVSEKLTQDTEGQSEAWFAGMNGDSIFGYSLPTWGLHYWLKPNATSADNSKTTEGDWRMIQGPSSWFWGGTWVGATETSTMKEEAADLISYITTDAEFLKKWAEDTGDFVSNEKVVDEIKDNYSEEFLGGQNHYNEFSEMVADINAKILTEYDQTIERLFIDNCLTPYSKGEMDQEQAIQSFKDAVQNAYPDLQVD
ncbi:ABC transporter substrate-binding protein [Enterococcus mediterraneensis]|uniref:ABC transporter substrate-binding protein n=1 Tax=Enterococcus mediterraneensis TaxID=2364791 RepID=UPI000F064ACC|nr:ABC transporter substrate-binding protein [Enterococcus mediterraneensis]